MISCLTIQYKIDKITKEQNNNQEHHFQQNFWDSFKAFMNHVRIK